jgi:hypothetical protein
MRLFTQASTAAGLFLVRAPGLRDNPDLRPAPVLGGSHARPRRRARLVSAPR